jgi:hypothetical protein
MKNYWGVELQLLTFLTSMEVSGQQPLRPLYPRDKGPPLLIKRLGGLQSQSGRGSEEVKSYPCPYLEFNPSHAARSIFTILTELPQLLTCVSMLLISSSLLNEISF